MSKTFTVNVPDQLWVDSWTTNKTESYTYSGPDTLYVLVSKKTNDILEWSTDPIVTTTEDIVAEINTSDVKSLPVAHFLHSKDAEYEYTYEDEINHDGSVYEKITNPTLKNYFDIKYDEDNGLYLEPIYKNPKTIAEEKAEKRLEYVNRYVKVYDFDAETKGIIDTFTANMDAYMKKMATVYPWKYVTIDENEIPKIPVSLVSVFNTLPEVE